MSKSAASNHVGQLGLAMAELPDRLVEVGGGKATA
jgi:hypothetical protein